MPVLSHPDTRTFLSGLGIGAALVGAVIAVFALASGIVAFSVWPGDPAAGATGSLVLDPPAAQRSRQRAIVLSDRRSTLRTAAVAVSASAPAPVRPGRPRGARGPHRGESSQVSVTGASTPGSAGTEPVAGSPGTPPAPAPTSGLAAVGEAVQTLTDSLSRSLRAQTDALAATVEPLSPELGTTVEQTGAVVGAVVGSTGALVASLLERPHASGPGADAQRPEPPPR